jgi:hypothetical protein
MNLLVGQNLSDRAGLRGIPNALIPHLPHSGFRIRL